jgi:hypothetical protein
MTMGTLGAGRVGLKKLFGIESDKVQKQYIDIVGRVEKTRQASEIFKQYIGLGPSTVTNEGDTVDWDELSALYVSNFKPLLYTKGMKFSIQTEFTDQYGVIKNVTPRLARSFVHRRNLNVADLDNSGFTTTANGGKGYGMNSEALYSAGHNMGSSFGYNRPLAPGQSAGVSATTMEVGFSPLGLEQAYTDIRKQKDARGMPMFPLGKLDVKVPAALLLPAQRAIRSVQLAGSNVNDPNVLKDRFNDPKIIDYYTSDIAWFVKASSPDEHGLFFLEQMPYDVFQLPMDAELMHKWAAYESWVFGWFDWHGTLGTQGQ